MDPGKTLGGFVAQRRIAGIRGRDELEIGNWKSKTDNGVRGLRLSVFDFQFPISNFLLGLALVGGCARGTGPADCTLDRVTPSGPAVRIDGGSATAFESRIAAVGTSFAVFWAAGGSLEETDLFGRVVDASGIPGSPETRLTLASGASRSLTVAAGNGTTGAGRIALAWHDGRLSRPVAMAAVAGPPFGSLADPAVLQGPVVADDQAPWPSIAAVGTGFVAVWNGRGADGVDHLYAVGISADGSTVGEPARLDAGSLDRATRPSAAGIDGGLAVVDAQTRDGAPVSPQVYAYVLSSAGESSAATFETGRPAREPRVAAAGATAAAVWCEPEGEGERLRFGSFVADGIAGMRVLAETATCPASITGAGGSLLVAWNERRDGSRIVRLLPVAANGLPKGAERELFRGDDPGDATLAAPDGAFNGRAVGVTWVDGGAVWFRPLDCPR